MELTMKESFLVCMLLTSICAFLYANSYKSGDPANIKLSTFKPNSTNSTDAFQTSKIVRDHEYTCKEKIRHGMDFTVIYNAMPKTGSRTFTSLARTVIKAIFKKSKKKKSKRRAAMLTRGIGSTQLKEFYESARKRAVLIRGHNVFVQPPSRHFVCVNIIREPIPWILSGYYYAMNGDGGRKQPRNSSQTFDECLSNDSSFCIPSVSKYLRYFCGDLSECYTAEALNLSKANFDKFLVVGLTEDYQTTMRIFERLMPDLFEGLVNAYNENSYGMRRRSRTIQKPEPTKETMETLRNNPDVIKMYEFYETVKRRFEELRTCLFDQDTQETSVRHRENNKRKQQRTKGNRAKGKI